MKRYVSRGITLIEMMIAIAILAIIIALSAPGFLNLILSNQISGSASDFIDALRRAKTESSARLTTVTVCTRNGDNCNANGDWDDGWLVFLNDDGNNTRDTDETIIYEQEALDQRITFTATDGNNNPLRILSFTPSGNTTLAGSGAATFTLQNQDGTISRSILVTVAGHASPL